MRLNRSQRSTIGMIFSLRQLQEKCREQRQSLYIAFMDLTKAFDLGARPREILGRDARKAMFERPFPPPAFLRVTHYISERRTTFSLQIPEVFVSSSPQIETIKHHTE